MSISKKSILTIIGVMFIAMVAIVFSACGGDDGKNKNPSSYSVTCQDGQWYDISSASQIVPAGNTVTITVETQPFIMVDKVFANGVECVASDTAGQYTFTMPEADVTITATVVDAPEITTAEYGMGWSSAPSQISVAEDGDTAFLANQDFSFSFGNQQGFITNTTNTDGYLSNVKIYSTNQAVIKDEALSGATATSVTSGYQSATAAKFTVDLTQVKLGTTTIVVEDTQKGRIISKTVTVVPFGQAVNGDVWTVYVTVDVSALEGTDYQNSDFRVFLSDNSEEYVYGSTYNETQWLAFEWADLVDGKKTFEFKYNPEHEFDIYVGYGTTNQYDNYVYMSFNLVGGVEESQIEDRGIAVFDENGATITIEVDDANL